MADVYSTFGFFRHIRILLPVSMFGIVVVIGVRLLHQSVKFHSNRTIGHRGRLLELELCGIHISHP